MLSLLLLLAAAAPPLQAASAPVDSYKVVARLPHSTEHYTEGFLYLDGVFWEGTGLEAHSGIYATDPETGAVRQTVEIAPQYFGEGIVDWGTDLYEWTWKSHTCFVYDRSTLRLRKQFVYGGEGWGMTRTGTELITSDGTATLRFRDPETFGETRHIEVTDGGRPVYQLNELEYVRRPGSSEGEIYANVWHSDRIARISPKDGHVLRWIDLSGLLPDVERLNGEAVLNGIAYDAKNDRLFVTGKQWPTIFEIKIVPETPAQARSH